MPDDCIFCKIASGEIHVEPIYSDDEVIAFRDINPQAPVHVLVIPRAHVGSLRELSEVDLGGKLLLAAAKVAQECGIAQHGFRTVINTGDNGGQTVGHLHLHILGGRFMNWPPG